MSNEVILKESDFDIAKELLAKDLTDAEWELFKINCERAMLNPALKQIMPLVTTDRHGNRRMNTLILIDGFRLIADRTKRYAPGSATEYYYNDKGKLLGARVFVKKQTHDGTWHEMSASALLSEYSSGRFIWQKMPHVMLEKVAEARAIRRAFPAETSGLYAVEEFDQALEPATIEVTESPVKTDAISDEEFNRMNDVINGYDDLRKELCSICSTTDLKTITKQQFAACQKYAQAWLKKKKD